MTHQLNNRSHRLLIILSAFFITNAVVAEFIQQQEKLLVFLKASANTDLNKVRIPISILQWLKLKLGDVFQFMIAHDERHLQQAKRNLKSSQV